MAYFGIASIHILLIAMAMALFCLSAAVVAQDVAIPPLPAMDTGAGFALPLYGTLICSSLLLSLISLFLH
ncbi:unnamed protein product [Camellia sinensis]